MARAEPREAVFAQLETLRLLLGPERMAALAELLETLLVCYQVQLVSTPLDAIPRKQGAARQLEALIAALTDPLAIPLV